MKNLFFLLALNGALISYSQCPNTGISPTAICQDITVFLDATGNATIVDTDIDNGSFDDCGIIAYNASQVNFNCGDITTAPANDIIITGLIDGPLPGGLPKAIELYVVNNIADLSQYGLGSANNGGGTDGEEFTFPAVAATAGSFIYVATESVEFTNFFGFAPDFTNGTAPNINGDDAVELFYQSNVIDVFGDINVDGTGQPWEYLDGWAYRNNNTGPDGSNFTLANWGFSGINALDGETSNGTAAIPFPAGTFFLTGPFVDPIPVTLTVVDGEGNASMCVANVTVKDAMSPVADMATLPDLTDPCSIAAPTAPTATDNCSGSIAGAADVTFPITAPGTTIITWTYDDGNGQVVTQTQNAIISDAVLPTASNPGAVNVACNADIPAVDITVVFDEADNCTAAPLVAFVSDVSDGNTCPEVITRTYSVTDDALNQIMVTQTITVNDLTNPTASNPANIVVECIGDVPAPDALVVIDEADNCATPVVAFVSDVSDGNTCPEVITRTYSVTDNCSNQIMVAHTITVDDTTDPVADVASLLDVNAECQSTPTAPTATDNCSGVLTGVPDVAFPITTVGTTVVTWTYTDNCSNVSTQAQNIIVSAIDNSVTQSGANLTSNSTGGTYQWLDCDNNFAELAGMTSQAFVASANGSYAVEITIGACVDTSACYLVEGVGFEEFSGEIVNVYPNPTNGNLNLSFGEIYSEINVTIKSVSGQVIQSETFQTTQNIELNFTGANGLYLIEVITSNGESRVVKVYKN